MIRLDTTILTIEKLLAENTEASLTYAALECRLAIERVCYERLRFSHDYISHDDLKRWQPSQIVKTLIQEVEPSIEKGGTLSISKEPNPEGMSNPTLEDYQAVEFLPIGTQIGLNPRYLGKLWNALAKLALHVPLPKSKDATIALYGNAKNIKAKAEEALTEIKRINKGTLAFTGFGESISFECFCGKNNVRKLGALRDEQTLSCINPDCPETYTYKEDGTSFERRVFEITCQKCEAIHSIPQRSLEKLRPGERGKLKCKGCGDTIHLQLRPFQAQQ